MELQESSPETWERARLPSVWVGVAFYFLFFFLCMSYNTDKGTAMFFRANLLCKQVELSNIAKEQYLPFSIFSGVVSMCQLLRDALVSNFPGHEHLRANESQELCPFNQHLCNTKINLFSVWQCYSGGTEGPIQGPTLVAPDPEKHRWSCLLQRQHTRRNK